MIKKRKDVDAAIASLRSLSPIQVEVISGMIKKFAEPQVSEHLRKDFLDDVSFEYFSTRLSAHHASSAVALKKENFEHILEHAFTRSGHYAKLTDSMVHRGADLEVDGQFFSLKTEAAKGISPKSITISKLMEARWIRDLRSLDDVPPMIKERILPHFEEYQRIFMLRSYGSDEKIRYDLCEIPKEVLTRVGDLTSADFSQITKAGGTGANVIVDGKKIFRLVLDGSVEKVTISGLTTRVCPLHAWWELNRPG